MGVDLAIDGDGHAYVAGEAYDTSFPTTAGAYQTAFRGDVGDVR